MTNFVFKSKGTSDLQKINHLLEMVQNELRHNRVDNAYIISVIDQLLTNKNLQKQVDNYFEDDGYPKEPPASADLD